MSHEGGGNLCPKELDTWTGADLLIPERSALIRIMPVIRYTPLTAVTSSGAPEEEISLCDEVKVTSANDRITPCPDRERRGASCRGTGVYPDRHGDHGMDETGA